MVSTIKLLSNRLNTIDLIQKSKLSKEEILYLLNLKTQREKSSLFAKAKEYENNLLNSEINSYGLIEISTFCSEDCNYCRLRNENTEIARERMNREQIIEIAKQINISGIKSIIIRSGYDDFYDVDRVAYIIYSIKKYADVEITLSLGQRSFEEYKEWKIAGATGYRLRFKSSSQKIYNSLNAYGTIRERVEHLNKLKSLGYQVCSGSIVGLPSQTIDDIASDLFFSKELNLDIVEFLPFCPQCNTPFESLSEWNKEDISQTLAVCRLIFKDSLRCSKPRFVFNLEENLVN